MTSSAVRAQVAGALGVTAVVVMVIAAGLLGPPRPAPIGTDRLGPESGTSVADYRAQARESLDGPDEPRYALVSLQDEITAEQAFALAGGARVTQLVFRVPLPRVQTPLTVVGVGEGRDSVLGSVDIAVDRLRSAASEAGDERGRRMAAVSARRIAEGCPCVVALTVRAPSSALRSIAERAQVRAVEALPADAVSGRFALVPLLPEITDIVEPLPDDGDVPAE